ncbi:MAG: LPP20 family lipoprotein [Syntrophales bacterium]
MRSKVLVFAAVLAGVLFVLAGAGFCQGQAAGDGKVTLDKWNKIIEAKVAETTPDGKGLINYEEGYIEAVGIGAPPERYYGKPQARPMALRAAQVDAYRNLLEVTKGVQIDSQTTVKDFVTESDIIQASVSGLVKNAKVTNREYMSDGTVEVTVRMSMSGTFVRSIIPKAITDDKKTDPPPPPMRPKPGKADDIFTGLVIDARGLGARPAMSPKVFDENGKEVYGTLVVNKEYAIQQGISGYARDLSAAQGNPRVTNHPFTVKALSAEGAGKSDLKIASTDAQKLRVVKENMAFLQKCRVMIVLD